MKFSLRLIFFFTVLLSAPCVWASDTLTHQTTHTTTVTDHDQVHADATHDAHAAGDHAHGGHAAEYDPAGTAIHHISDANVYTILDMVHLPLPAIIWSKDRGLEMFSSGKFHAGHHEDGQNAYNSYVMHHGAIYKVTDSSFPQGEVKLGEHPFTTKQETIEGKQADVTYLSHNGTSYRLDAKSTLDGGVLGGGITSFFDFSITKNVVSMFLVALFLFWVFSRAAKFYRNNAGKAPSGATNMLETIFLYIRDEVAIPFIGKDKYQKYFPLLLSIFFFILGLNLFGQVPFLGSVNVTGNLSVTMIIAVIVFIIVNINGNKHYWAHIFWMPGVSIPMKLLLAVIEFMSMFIKPLTLMLRLAGNISAGHIAILSFIGLIFIFGKSGASLGGSAIGTVMAIPLTMFMMAIELIVAFVQAYVFTILTASYIGAATEESHHDDHAHTHH
jgi:F-type H+-transporting ATPase subunit a